MYYYGEFRNTDTTVDNKGQLYKVCIFTNGTLYTYLQLIPSGDLVPAMEEITLSDKPFVVDYANDDNNIYKPYKGSSASVGIVLNKVNNDFISSGKCDIKVVLLKWKNEVILTTNGNLYYNTITGETLGKKHFGNRNMFDPEEENNFCYTVEWSGYATPCTFNQPYTKVLEEYTLECQDVLTTLQYFDYPNNEVGVSTFAESIFNALNLIPNNTITTIYTTNTIKLPEETLHSIIDNLSTINGNWINEDNEWNDSLTVIANLMQYIGCTIIQWKDSLYITTPDAISNKRQYYYKHTINSQSTPLVLIDGEKEISDGELGNSETNISTTSTYKEVKVSTNEYYDENLSLDLSEGNEYIDELSRWDILTSYIKIVDYDRNVLSHDHPYNYDVENAVASYSGSILQYNPDTTLNLPTIQTWCYGRDTKDTDDEIYLIMHTNQVANATTLRDIVYKSGCSLVDFGCGEISTNNAMADYFKNYNGKRVFLFHTTAEQIIAANTGFAISPLMADTDDIKSSNQNNYKMLKITTKKTFIKSSQSLQLKGDWTFYQNITLPLASGWAVDVLKANKPYMFIWMKIAIPVGDTTYYLKNTSSSQYYEWDTTERWCKVWYDNFAGLDPEANRKNRLSTTSNAFETTFSFSKNTRGADGTCIPLPNIDAVYTNFEITIARPYGCCLEKKVSGAEEHFYCPQYSVLSDFEVRVIDKSETEFRYNSDFNNEFIGKSYEDAIDDFSKIDLMISSDYYKNSSKSTVLGVNNNRLFNQATGTNTLPEANIIKNIIRTYKNSRLRLEITLPHEITPFTLVKWATQFYNKKFVVDSMSIDYAYNDYTLNLFEKTLDTEIPVVYAKKKTRNFRRNGDNLYNPIPRRNGTIVNDTESDFSPFIPYSFTQDSDGNEYVNKCVLRYIHFEPIVKDGEMFLYVPDYLFNDWDCFVNNDGEIIIEK